MTASPPRRNPPRPWDRSDPSPVSLAVGLSDGDGRSVRSTTHLLSLNHLVSHCRSDGGIVRPSAFAVLRLIASSNRVGRSTGESLGFAPSGSCRRSLRPAGRPQRALPHKTGGPRTRRMSLIGDHWQAVPHREFRGHQAVETPSTITAPARSLVAKRRRSRPWGPCTSKTSGTLPLLAAAWVSSTSDFAKGSLDGQQGHARQAWVELQSNSIRFPASSAEIPVRPVMLPPGCAKARHKARPHWISSRSHDDGIVRVASFAACTAGVGSPR